MKNSIAAFLITGLLFLVATTQAQVRFSIGPRVGLNLANVPFEDKDRTYDTKARAGVEAGFVVNIGFGHFAVRPAFLYTQKGFRIEDTYTTKEAFGGSSSTTTTLNEQYRLNYFTVPLNLVYSIRQDGQGLELFAGPYLGWLLGGKYSYDDKFVRTDNGDTSTYFEKAEGDIGKGDYYTTNRTDTKFYSRGLDAGLQFGLGFRAGGALFQAGYSLGVRDLGADFKVISANTGSTRIIPGPTYSHRALQASFTYLFGPKS